MRCKHQNGTLYEFMNAAHCRDVADGTMEIVGENIIGNISGYAYECDDCGKRFTFRATPRLKWLRKIYRQLRREF